MRVSIGIKLVRHSSAAQREACPPEIDQAFSDAYEQGGTVYSLCSERSRTRRLIQPRADDSQRLTAGIKHKEAELPEDGGGSERGVRPGAIPNAGAGRTAGKATLPGPM